MIRPEQRVSKPARKSSRNVAAAMGKRRRRTGCPQQQRYRDGWNLPVPCVVMTGSAMRRVTGIPRTVAL
jgi:hypothetical protein